MEMNIRFYKPSEAFKNTKEMVCVGTDKSILATFGPNSFSDQKSFDNWIDTSAQAVMFLMSFDIFKLFFQCDVTYQMRKDMEEIMKETIKDYVSRLDNTFTEEHKEILEDRIFDRLEQIIGG